MTLMTASRAARLYPDLQARARARTWSTGIHDPEDAAQMMALALLTGSARHDGAAITFAHRRAIDQMRAEVRRQARIALDLDAAAGESEDRIGDLFADEAAGIERVEERMDRRARLERLKRALPEWGPRMIDLLAQGYATEEIAAELQITVTNARVRLHRIRAVAAELE